MDELSFIRKNLADWYPLHARDLPWRNTDNPYIIWISEIILQQTRVIQGLDYFNRFIERFPDVHVLAEADEREVLKYWQGLGYYSRARNLHFAAKQIENDFGGEFPKDYDSVLSLKGVGEYTAAAIVSFAYQLPYPVVDGNVFRFLSRFFLIDIPIDLPKGKKEFTELAGKLLDKTNAGLFNSAIMEFGALQCVPGLPDCSVCPLMAQCGACMENRVLQFPVKQNKTKIKTLYLYYFHVHFGKYTYIYKRSENGIWRNLYEFPMIESETPLEAEQLSEHPTFKKLFSPAAVSSFQQVVKAYKHVLTHRILYVDFYEIDMEKEADSWQSYSKIEADTISEYPVHKLMQSYIEKKNQEKK
jgi:A/G-specific adenine glycosylase